MNEQTILERLTKQLSQFRHNTRVTVENNKFYVTVSWGISDNRFFEEHIEELEKTLSLHLNRKVIYKGYKSILCGTAPKFEVEVFNIIDEDIPTLDYCIIFREFQEKDSFYLDETLVISLVNALREGIEVPGFTIKDDEVFYNNERVLVINVLKDSVKQCNRSGSTRDYDCWYYHMYLTENNNKYPLTSLLNKIALSYNKSHTANLTYGSLGRENSNWIITDTREHFYGDWNKYILQEVKETTKEEVLKTSSTTLRDFLFGIRS